MSDSQIFDELKRSRFNRRPLIVKQIGAEWVLYDEQTSTAHCLNGVAAEIWTACEEETSGTDIKVALRFERPDVRDEDILASLNEMLKLGILEESTSSEAVSVSRRELVRKLGLTAAIALPIAITSVLVPPAAATASCGHLGALCSGTKPCCPGIGLGCVAGTCVGVGH